MDHNRLYPAIQAGVDLAEVLLKFTNRLGYHIHIIGNKSDEVHHSVSYHHEAWQDKKVYDVYAKDKAELSMKIGMSTHEVVLQPWLFMTGDITYPGGWYGGNHSIGVSGLNGVDDVSVGQLIDMTYKGESEEHRKAVYDFAVFRAQKPDRAYI